jgi:hypothetical protein
LKNIFLLTPAMNAITGFGVHQGGIFATAVVGHSGLNVHNLRVSRLAFLMWPAETLHILDADIAEGSHSLVV